MATILCHSDPDLANRSGYGMRMSGKEGHAQTWMEARGDRASYLLDLNHQKIMLTMRLDRINPILLPPLCSPPEKD